MQDHADGRGGPTPSWPDPCKASLSSDETPATASQQPDALPTVNTTEVKTKKRTRRLKPEYAAKFAAIRTTERVRELYDRPVEDLSPEELAKMRAAFFRG